MWTNQSMVEEGNVTDTPDQTFRVTVIEGQSDNFLYGLAINRCLIVLFGVPGNILILITTLYCKRLQTVTNVLTIQIAFSNLIQCLFNIPYSAYIIFNSHLTHHNTSCLVMAHLLVIEILTTILVFAVVAINRYILVVGGKSACRQVFTRRNTAIFIALIWAWSTLLSIVPHMGLGKLGYNHLLIDCLFVIEDFNTYFYIIVLCATTLAPCLIITGICYVKIALLLWSVNNKIHNAATTITVRSQAETNRKIKTMRTVLSLMVIFMAYLTVWAPFGVLLLGDRHAKWHPLPYAIIAHLILAQNAIFPVMYGVFNKNHREAHWLMVRCEWRSLREL